MATSGTIGTTTLDVTKVLEHAFRRAQVTTSKITGEQQLAAQDNLFLLLTDLANDGVNLWCIQKTLIALVAGQKTYQMPVGTVDLLRAFVRTMIYPTGAPLSAATYLGLNAGASYTITTVGLTASASATQNLVFEYSPDGVSWTTLYTIPTFASTAGQLYWFDLPVDVAASAWRVRETVAGSIAVSSVQFGSTPSDILLTKLTRDQYWFLPNKDAAGKALQYWYDKQIQPQIWVWQVPNDPTQLIVTELHMHIQDVGALSNTLAIPQRWINNVIWQLAVLVAHERPPGERDPAVIQFCEAKAEKSRRAAEMGESDGAPMQIMPNLRAYTR